ncbi:MAG: cyclic nucleotide-binding domain-containing protein [Sulfurisoma sp.]|nr:cyclic nucleotide-binding domain-containing protein [Sulfurisoma sp.]
MTASLSSGMVMTGIFKIAIIGSGPSGLSAAARAAECGVSHILLEAEQQPANTIRKFQKAKHVMAEPAALPFRSTLSFAAGSREKILETWNHELEVLGVNLRTGAQVVSLTGKRGAFRLGMASGETLEAEFIVLAVGLQSNIRRLGVPGGDLPRVQYQLDDPDEFQDETIVVVGAGDAGVENALALMRRNDVILINRQESLISCRESNFVPLLEAIKQGVMECRHDTMVEAIEATGDGGLPLRLVAHTPGGVERIACDRVIARLGADPPRRLLESFGIAFHDGDASALPVLSSHYESNVPGLYIVGALAGYPLIKQAMNQGHDVVDRILGKPVIPVDEPLLWERFGSFRHVGAVEEGLGLVQRTVPLLAGLTTLQLRDFLLASEIRSPAPDEIIFQRNEYSTTFFCIVEGEIELYVGGAKPDFVLGAGAFFGEMSLVSGRRRSGTVKAGRHCTLIETPRRTMLKLIDSVESVRRILDESALKRAVHSYIGLSLQVADLDRLVHGARVQRYEAGEALFREGDKADGLYLIRRGSVTVSRRIGGKEVVLSYVAAGNYVGEMALISGKPRYATVRAAVATEAILLAAGGVADIMERHPAIRSQMDERFFQYMRSAERDSRSLAGGDPRRDGPASLMAFLMEQGIGEATDVLLIDYSLCIRCDNCETACAGSHGGTSRLHREGGQTHGSIHVPTSCRHCEHPHCMKECPPDAIHRSVGGEVYIDDSCIGCGNCERDCPYDVIRLAPLDTPNKPPGLWSRLLPGKTVAPPAPRDESGAEASRRAVKCDMCKDLDTGPACVRECPTGAALRVSPAVFLEYARRNAGEAAPPAAEAYRMEAE